MTNGKPEVPAEAVGSPQRRWRTPLVVVVTGLLGIVAGMGVGAGIWAGAPVSETSTPQVISARTSSSTGGSDLFVVDGSSGSAIEMRANTWRIALAGPSVLWFKDRPLQGSGSESAAAFVSAWNSYFPDSPPYGAVLAPAGPPGHHPTAVKLTSPSFDPSTGIVSFTLTLDEGQSTADASWLSRLTPGAATKNGRVVLFIDDSSTGSNSQDDESIIEYFNEMLFSDEFTIETTDVGNAFDLLLTCPPPLSPTIPSPDFDLTMWTANQDQSTTCSGDQQIVILKSDLSDNQNPNCHDSVCNFVVTLTNRTTMAVYCSTVIQVTMTSGDDSSIIPDLEPATLPIYPEPQR